MTDEPNCQQISLAIKAIKLKTAEVDLANQNKDFKVVNKLIDEVRTITKEIEAKIWPLEILTGDEFLKQYNEWEEVYQNLSSEYKLPTRVDIVNFLHGEPEFFDLMKTKERQGLTKMIIAPAPGFYSLKDLAQNVVSKIKENGGGVDFHFSKTWEDLFKESDARYFGKITDFTWEGPQPEKGVTCDKIRAFPGRYGICDGWMISFTTDEDELSRMGYPDQDTGEGRKAIKTGESPMEYYHKYFSGFDNAYEGEESMIPQEYLALFEKYLYERYIKVGKKIAYTDTNLPDTLCSTWFISTYIVKNKTLPYMGWNVDDKRFYAYDRNYSSSNSNHKLGVRSVVRRTLNT